jgi:SpoVK/Ycf46/Vps4 family AAA+-type ATPase
MNQDLLIRLFKTIEGEKNDDLIKIASKIIEDENKKGHSRLALKLREILDKNILSYSSFKGELKELLPRGVVIPTDKRYNIPLAHYISRDELRHEMILSHKTELRIKRIEKEYVARERLQKHGLSPKRKIFLYGAPGCGKSMAAERIAWNIGLPFLKVRFEAIMSSYLGESASNLKKLFDSIKNFPCVLLLDEFDFVAKSRISNQQDVGEMNRIVNILLGLLEDYDAPGLLIATTNIEGMIDQAIFRRFDEIIEIPRPTKKEILELLKLSLSAMKVESNVDWNNIAVMMEGYSASLVVKIAKDAAKEAVVYNNGIINYDNLQNSLSENSIFNK